MTRNQRRNTFFVVVVDAIWKGCHFFFWIVTATAKLKTKQSRISYLVFSEWNIRNNIYQIHIVNIPEQLKHIQQSSYLLLFVSMCYCFQWQIEWEKVYQMKLFYRQSFITLMWRLLGSLLIWILKVRYLYRASIHVKLNLRVFSFGQMINVDCSQSILHFISYWLFKNICVIFIELM